MKKSDIKVLPIFLIILVFFTGLTYYMTNQSNQSKIENLESRYNSEIETLSTQINDIQTQLEEKNQELEMIQNFMGTYFKAMNHLYLAWIAKVNAEYYYDLASWSYDNNYLQDTIDYCVQARSYYLDASQKFKNSEALFKKANNTAPNEHYIYLSTSYVGLTDSGSKLMTYMYEACEYFESASLKYLQYYDTGNEEIYEIANSELEEMNKRIEKHDKEVDIYNDYLAEINAILET